jgi:hypothetical protein
MLVLVDEALLRARRMLVLVDEALLRARRMLALVDEALLRARCSSTKRSSRGASPVRRAARAVVGRSTA